MAITPEEALGSRLNELVKTHDRTIAWLSRQTGLEYRLLGRRMKNPGTLGIAEIYKIAVAFGEDPNWLYTGIRVEDAA